MELARFIARRLLLTIPLVFVVAFATFMIVRIGGQDPVGLLAGPTASTAEIQQIRAELGLDRSLLSQFGIYLSHLAQGNFGESWLNNRPVLDDIIERAPVTLELLLWGVGLGVLIGVPVGLRAAFHPGGPFDQASRFMALTGFSIPTYWLGLLMLFVFFYLLGWAPPGMGRLSLMVVPPPTVTGSYLLDGLLAGDLEVARSAAAHLLLPASCVAIVAAAPIIKQTRAIALEVLSSDPLRYGRASGFSKPILRRMVLLNGAAPVITFIGTELAGLVGTTALIEYVFAWGGLGQYGLQAIISGDFTAVQGYVVVLALFSVAVFLVVDVLVWLVEPRARSG